MDGTMATVMIFAGNFAPRNWEFCQGQLISIAQNSALFALIGTIYGGDGRTTFQLPDLRGRVPIGAGQGNGLSDYRLGARGGQESVALTINEMPSHNHSAQLTETAPAIISGKIATGNTGRGSSSSNSPDGNYISEIPSGFRTGEGTGSLNGLTVNLTQPQYTATIGNTGGNQAHENRQPWLAMNYVICTQGMFPSRS